jgi:predicted nucleotidyltransferase
MVTSDMVNWVRRELETIEAAEDIRVLYAVESGSRAWGFASTDSDYDVRLVYIRRPEWYLSVDLETRRDVIERACPGDIDLSGWDIRKTLRLIARSNPPLLEWLDSPVVYRDDGVFAAELRALVSAYYSPAACLHHYVRMARRNHDAYLRGERVRHKKYFYVLRPLLAARWIEQGRGPVPMLFATLLETVASRFEFLTVVDELLTRKTAGMEMGEGPRVPAIHDLVAAELPRLEAVAAGMAKTPLDLDPLHELFRRTLSRVW